MRIAIHILAVLLLVGCSTLRPTSCCKIRADAWWRHSVNVMLETPSQQAIVPLASPPTCAEVAGRLITTQVYGECSFRDLCDWWKGQVIPSQLIRDGDIQPAILEDFIVMMAHQMAYDRLFEPSAALDAVWLDGAWRILELECEHDS